MKKIILAITLTLSTFAFNAQGMQLPLPPADTEITRLIQPDGKTLVLSLRQNPDAWTVSRFNTNGELDEIFATYGRTGFLMPHDTPIEPGSVRMYLQPNGKILVKYTMIYNDDRTPMEALFNSNGTLDATFNPDGGGVATGKMERLP